MTRVRIVLVIAALVCGACGGRSLAATPASPTVAAEFRPLEDCPCTSADRLDSVVALAIDGLEQTTSESAWSGACARVRAPGDSEEPYTVTVRIAWMGTLHEYSSMPGAAPIVGLADEAYAPGRQVTVRSGELVAVVSRSGANASATEAWARRVAEQLAE